MQQVMIFWCGFQFLDESVFALRIWPHLGHFFKYMYENETTYSSHCVVQVYVIDAFLREFFLMWNPLQLLYSVPVHQVFDELVILNTLDLFDFFKDQPVHET